MLADEITADLRAIREDAVTEAQTTGQRVKRTLKSKGIRYGEIIARPDGQVVTSEIEGVNPDLRVRPFFHHGQTISIREFIIGAFKDEMGLQSPDPILCAVNGPRQSSAGSEPHPGLFLIRRRIYLNAHRSAMQETMATVTGSPMRLIPRSSITWSFTC